MDIRLSYYPKNSMEASLPLECLERIYQTCDIATLLNIYHSGLPIDNHLLDKFVVFDMEEFLLFEEICRIKSLRVKTFYFRYEFLGFFPDSFFDRCQELILLDVGQKITWKDIENIGNKIIEIQYLIDRKLEEASERVPRTYFDIFRTEDLERLPKLHQVIIYGVGDKEKKLISRLSVDRGGSPKFQVEEYSNYHTSGYRVSFKGFGENDGELVKQYNKGDIFCEVGELGNVTEIHTTIITIFKSFPKKLKVLSLNDGDTLSSLPESVIHLTLRHKPMTFALPTHLHSLSLGHWKESTHSWEGLIFPHLAILRLWSPLFTSPSIIFFDEIFPVLREIELEDISHQSWPSVDKMVLPKSLKKFICNTRQYTELPLKIYYHPRLEELETGNEIGSFLPLDRCGVMRITLSFIEKHQEFDWRHSFPFLESLSLAASIPWKIENLSSKVPKLSLENIEIACYPDEIRYLSLKDIGISMASLDLPETLKKISYETAGGCDEVFDKLSASLWKLPRPIDLFSLTIGELSTDLFQKFRTNAKYTITSWPTRLPIPGGDLETWIKAEDQEAMLYNLLFDTQKKMTVALHWSRLCF